MRSRLLATCIGPSLVLLAASSPAHATTRACGEVAGGRVVTVHGRIPCRTARVALRYAVTHPEGNGPASPHGWRCNRIPGSNPAYNGYRCIGAYDSEAHPRSEIEDRFFY